MKERGGRFEVEEGDDREQVFAHALKKNGGPTVMIMPDGKVFVVGQLIFSASFAKIYEPKGNEDKFKTDRLISVLEKEHSAEVVDDVSLEQLRTGIVGPFSPADLVAAAAVLEKNLERSIQQYAPEIGGQKKRDSLPPQVQEILDALMNDIE